ncbi:hypothetical protein Q31b_34550 [Novipirellula aureliae]|uniref:Uncharacterized protein n=1 Tax=Novipirellula aureliae TaxID=2527966 RepID=A0A5C6DXJ6_9BACT|nr:hypothetical protein Q31b_34550 [Novipirellula aureliae]
MDEVTSPLLHSGPKGLVTSSTTLKRDLDAPLAIRAHSLADAWTLFPRTSPHFSHAGKSECRTPPHFSHV